MDKDTDNKPSPQKWWPQPSSPALSRWWHLPSRWTHLKWRSQHNLAVLALTLTLQDVLPTQSNAKTHQIKILTRLTFSVPRLNPWLFHPTYIPTWIPYNFPNCPLFSLLLPYPSISIYAGLVPYLDDASATMVIVNCLNEDPTHPAYLHLYDFISSLIPCKNTLQELKPIGRPHYLSCCIKEILADYLDLFLTHSFPSPCTAFLV